MIKTKKCSNEEKTKKPLWKKWWFWLIVVTIGVSGSSSEDTTQQTSKKTVVENEQKNSETQVTENSQENEKETELTQTNESEQETLTEDKFTEDVKTEIVETESKIETEIASDYNGKNIDDIDAHFSVSKVRNDATGNWRISSIAESINIEEYALSYYKKYFSNNTEIHAIVNFTHNTTAKLTVMGNILDVSIYEYVDNEEHDANLLFSGMLLKQYFVYMDTGEIEEI